MSLPAQKPTSHQNQGPTHIAIVPSETPTGGAGFWLRFAAFFIDHLILGAALAPIYFIAFVIAAAASGAGDQQDPEAAQQAAAGMLMIAYLFMAPAAMAITWAYFGLFQKFKGGTPGKLALGLRVVNAQTGENLTFWHSVGRLMAYTLSAIPLYVGFMMIGFRGDKRGLHDLVAGTRVIKK